MRESTLVPTNLLNWPRIAPMLPELKLLTLALWSSPYMSMCGCGLVPLRPFASTLGLSTESTQSALDLLEQAGLIVSDRLTGEIFVRDWFRFHKFSTGKIYGGLLSSVEKIESQELKTLVRSLIPSAPAYLTNTAPARAIDDVCERTGAILRDTTDREQIEALIKTHGTDKIKNLVAKIRESGGRSFISAINAAIRAAAPTAAESAHRKARGLDGARSPNAPLRQTIGQDDTPAITVL